MTPEKTWIAIWICVLLAIVKNRLNLSPTLYEFLQILTLSLVERVPFIQLTDSGSATEMLDFQNRWNLLNQRRDITDIGYGSTVKNCWCN
jgi:hypothetical protein